jgi:hypothetical protein
LTERKLMPALIARVRRLLPERRKWRERRSRMRDFARRCGARSSDTHDPFQQRSGMSSPAGCGT